MNIYLDFMYTTLMGTQWLCVFTMIDMKNIKQIAHNTRMRVCLQLNNKLTNISIIIGRLLDLDIRYNIYY